MENSRATFDTERLNLIAPDEIAAHGLLHHSPRGKISDETGYCCVYCNSGSRDNLTGALRFKFKDGIWKHYCDSCGNGGDNIRLFQAIFNANFQDSCARASEIFNVPVGANPSSIRDFTPTPRIFNSRKYYLAADVAKIIGVDRKTVDYWRNKGSFMPDTRDDNGSYLYSVESVNNFKSVYLAERSKNTKHNHTNFPYFRREQTDPKQLPLIQADIDNAKKSLRLLPQDQRRGLFQETLEHFEVGFLPQWTHPKNRVEGKNFPPSRRIIIPTPEHAHYLALALPADRRQNGTFDKPHAGVKQLFNPDALKQNPEEPVLIVEGEVDAMSIWQAKEQHPNVVATLSAAGFKNILLPMIDAGLIQWRKFIILLDADPTGRTNAKELQDALAARHMPAISKFLFDYLPPELQNKFGVKVDANDLLVNHAGLTLIIQKILADSQTEFGEIEQQTKLYFSDIGAFKVPPPPLANFPPSPHINFPPPPFCRKKDEKLQNVKVNFSHPDPLGFFPRNMTVNGDNLKMFDISKALNDWQALNGDINPEIVPRLVDAANFLVGLKSDNISAQIVLSAQTKHAAALCLAYDSCAGITNSFYVRLKQAQASALKTIKQHEDANADFADSSDLDELRFLAEISIRDFKADVDKIAKDYSKQQKQFKREESIRRKNEEFTNQQLQVVSFRDKTLARLDELRKQTPSPERDAQIIALINDIADWKFDSQKKPTELKSNVSNFDLIFKYDPVIDSLIGFNAFTSTDVFLKQPPWASESKIHVAWSDRDDSQLRLYLRRNYAEIADEKIFKDSIVATSDAHQFHDVRDFFYNLPAWDGQKRAEELFIKFLAVDDTAFAREITLNWLLAAVARIFKPGCRYQTALVLHGKQGIGKSYIIERLGGAWYNVIADNVNDDHAIDAIQNTWIGEFKEMNGMRKVDVNAIKAFIDTSEDNRRFAYHIRAKKVPRHCVFAITVNDDNFLRDSTGNRRYMILHCKNPAGTYVEGLTDQYIRQVWAEVFALFNDLFKDGFDEKKLELSKATRMQIEVVADEHIMDDGLISEILAWLDIKLPPDYIWDLMNKEERARFCRAGKIVIIDAERHFETQRTILNQRNKDDLNQKTLDYLNNSPYCYRQVVMNQGASVIAFHIYGCEYRQHVCAAEIINECFAPNDKRASAVRINELLNSITGWSMSKHPFRTDRCYKNQRKILWRDSDNYPTDFAKQNGTQTAPVTPEKDFFNSEPIDPDIVPF